MNCRALKLVLVLGSALVAVTAPTSRALAQFGGTGGIGGTGGTGMTGGGLTADDFLIRVQRLVDAEKDEWVFLNTDREKELFFNYANCACESPLRIVVEAKTASRTKLSARQFARSVLKVRIGNADCVASDARRMSAMCEDLKTITDLTVLARMQQYVTTTVTAIFRGGPMTGQAGGSICRRRGTSNIWLWIDTEPNDVPDLTDTSGAPTLGIRVTGDPPAAPADLKVTPGDQALSLSWTGVDNVTDFQGYQLFCSRGPSTPVFKQDTFEAKYSSPATLCPGTPQAAQAPLTGATYASDVPREGEPGPAPLPFQNLDPAFLCSDLLSSRTTARITGLENGVSYLVGVSAVDRFGNASPIQQAVLQVPIETRNFFEGYQEAGGDAEGGFCAVVRSPGRGGTGRLAWAFLVGVPVMGLLGRWRRRSRRAAPDGARRRDS